MGMSSRPFLDRLAARFGFQAALANVADVQFAPIAGGVLVLQDNRTVIVTVGVNETSF